MYDFERETSQSNVIKMYKFLCKKTLFLTYLKKLNN
jgi:hypothetical protein